MAEKQIVAKDLLKIKSKSGEATTDVTKSKSKSKSNKSTAKIVTLTTNLASMKKTGDNKKNILTAHYEVDVDSDRWPYCIVWTPLPVVTWFVPIIGHTGIANSKGIIYDFSDDYNVSVDNFSFGKPTKYYQFQPESMSHYGNSPEERWDKAIQETSDYYSRTRHSLFFNNCHQYIAGVLNKVRYSGRTDWTQTEVWWKITFRSTYTGFLGFIRQWWPFTVIIIAVIVFCSLAF